MFIYTFITYYSPINKYRFNQDIVFYYNKTTDIGRKVFNAFFPILTDLNNVSIMYNYNCLHPKPVHSSADPSVVWQTFGGSDGGNCGAAVIQVLVAHITHILHRHSIDAGIQLMDGDAAVVAQHLATNVFTHWGGAVQLEKHVSLQEVPGTLYFTLGNSVAELHPFLLNVVHHIF